MSNSDPITISMTIARIHHPQNGETRGWIQGTDRRIIGIFADKIGMFEEGKTYNITGTPWQANGKSGLNFKFAVLAQPDARTRPIDNVAPMQPVRQNAFQHAPQRDDEPSYATPSGAGSKDEQIFVMCGLKEFIRAGSVDPNPASVERTINMLRSAWASTFGTASRAFHASEAGKQSARG